MSRTLSKLYEHLGIKSIHTSAYHPQTDGLVERFNRTLKSMVRNFHKRRRHKFGQMARAPVVRSAGGPTSLHWVFPIRAPVWLPAPGGA